jgi:hypothetical protein
MPDASLYENDRLLARERGHRFDVAKKDGRGMRWIDIQRNIPDLHDAMVLAQCTDAYETGVFQDGFIYWTSAHPDLLNSTVITLRIERGS